MLHGWQYLRAGDLETIARGIENGEVYGGPFHIELDWVDACNAKCFFCASSSIHSDKSLCWERTRGILEEARRGGLRSIRLAGGGEPLLHPDFEKLAGWLDENDVVLDQVNTNGIALSDSRIAALMVPRVGEVHVSLNYCDAESYAEGMRLPGQTFEKVCDGITRLNETRKRDGSRFGRLTVQFFVYKKTLNQIVHMYELGKRLGADRISFWELYGIDPALQYEQSDVPAIAAQMREVFQADADGRVENLLWSRGAGPAISAIQNEIRPQAAPPAIDYDKRYCYIAWHSMTIIGSEAVYPCCYFFDEPRALDDLNGKTLGEVWRGANYRRMRQEFRRWFLSKVRVPMFSRRHRHMKLVCASHAGCPMSLSLADETFYANVDRRLEKVRRKIGARIKTTPEQIGRSALDKLRKHHTD